MDDILGTLLAGVLAVIMICIVPVMLISIKNDSTTQNYVTDAVNEFVDKSRTTGIISANNYRDFINRLDATGNTYDVTILHYSEQFNPSPVYRIDEDGNEVLDADGNKIIDSYTYQTNYLVHTKDEIVEVLFENITGSYINAMTTYEMNAGDYMQVTVESTNVTIGNKILGFFTGNLRSKTISSVYGGYVGSTAGL